MFQPGPMASNTICGVRAAAVLPATLKASPETVTVTFSPPQLTVTVPLPAVAVLFAAADTVTTVLCEESMSAAETPIHLASVLTVGWVEDVTVKVSTPPKRSKDNEVLSTDSSTLGTFCFMGIIRLCFSPMTRRLDERASVPLYLPTVTLNLYVLPDVSPCLMLTQESVHVTAGRTPLVRVSSLVPPVDSKTSSTGLATSFTGSGSGVSPPQAVIQRTAIAVKTNLLPDISLIIN